MQLTNFLNYSYVNKSEARDTVFKTFKDPILSSSIPLDYYFWFKSNRDNLLTLKLSKSINFSTILIGKIKDLINVDKLKHKQIIDLSLLISHYH
jgi:hypothetical protein